MECPSCQKENRGGRRFCAHCGAPLPLGCASCGFLNQPGDGFCGGCGEALAPPVGQGDSPAGRPAGAPAASAVPGGERRQATVLFSDLSGYTELNEQVDPEEVQAIMARVKEAATRIVEAHGGMVNQFVGDEVVALFGIPTAQEDDPRRAVAAALELHGAVRDIGAEMEPGQGQGLRLHSGINSGLVVTQLHDDRDGRYGITGDTVNIGARLAAAAQPGQILLGASTQALVKPYFELQPLSAVLLKGKEAPVTPFLVVRETKVHTRLEISAQRGFTPFIGRERELARLQNCIALAIAGQGQFASLVGDAGVGKSRLMYELRQTTDAGAAIMLEGSCEPSASGTPFYPFLAPLRELLELGDQPALDNVVATRLARIDPALEAKIPHVLRLLSIPSATHTLPAQLYGEELQRELRLALAAVVTSLARSRPVLLFFEDWHWCDEASDATLKYLGGLIAETPIMIVVNHRPDYQANWGNWGYSTIMPLAAFGEAESRQIAQQTLGVERFPEQLLAVIHERTGGNPFFLEELCRAMVEDGSLIIRNVKEAVLSGALENLALPETVQAVVRSRLDRLDKATREVVLNASVIGREFSGSLLEVLMPGASGIPAALERLKALEIVRQIRVLPEPEYRFQQVVTQEVAYDVQLLDRRRKLHRKLAEHLEENDPQRLPEIQELLAMHFLRGEVWPKAAAYSLAAAEQARSHFSYRAAMKLGRQALEAVQKGHNLAGEQVRALVLLGDLHSLLGDLEPANANYEQAMAQSGDEAETAAIANRVHHKRSVVRDGGKIAYYMHGAGSKTLLFANPALYGIATFQHLVENFCQDYRVITVDGRGSGESDPIPDEFSMRDHMEDVGAVIDDSQATSVVGIGLSRGSNQMIKLAAAYPDKLEKIVTIGMPVDDRGPDSLFPNPPDPDMVQALQEKDFDQYFRLFLQKNNPEPGLEDLNEERLKVFSALPEKTLLKFLAPDPEINVVPLFGKIAAPVLLIHGELDLNVDPKHADYAAGQIPDALVYKFPRAGHNPWLTALAEFCAVVRQFVETGEVEGAQRRGLPKRG